MTALLIAGSPSARSRTAAFAEAAGQRLQNLGARVDRLRLRELAPEALLWADYGDATISRAIGQVAQADVVVLATPVYKAAYSGLLKVFLDVLPQDALRGKTVLPLATGGSPNHMLALDYALRPVLQSLAPRQVLQGIYATDAQVTLSPQGHYQLAPEIAARLDDAVDQLLVEALRPQRALAGQFATVDFSQVRCSV